MRSTLRPVRRRHNGASRDRPYMALTGLALSFVVILGVGVVAWHEVATGKGLRPYWAMRSGTWTFPVVGALGIAPILLVAVGVAVVLGVRAVRARLRNTD